jgi:hypothetical protein
MRSGSGTSKDRPVPRFELRHFSELPEYGMHIRNSEKDVTLGLPVSATRMGAVSTFGPNRPSGRKNKEGREPLTHLEHQ